MREKQELLEDRLRRAILECGLSANKLATLSGVAQPVLTRFINGTRGITLATAGKVAEALGLELVAKRKGR
jgi:plasmid maintenance system antidote protein VapI